MAVLLMFSCKKDEDQPIPASPPSTSPGQDAVLVSNEGPFSAGSGTLTFVNLTTGESSHQVFENINGYPLGNIVQSSHQAGGFLYVVVNNAQKIEVMDYPGYTSHNTINNLGSPRYMVSHNDIGYVSDWTSGGVHTVDLNNHQVTGQIPTGPGPEMMCIIDDRLFVANSGGLNDGNTVTVIDVNTQSVIDNIVVADNPQSLVKDANGKLRVLCRGVNDWSGEGNDTSGALFEIDPQSLEVTGQIDFPSVNDHPAHLSVNSSGSELYYLLNGNVYSISANAVAIPDASLIQGNFYALNFHAGAELLMATDALDYQQNGKVHVFSTEGVETAVFEAGVIPGHLLPL